MRTRGIALVILMLFSFACEEESFMPADSDLLTSSDPFSSQMHNATIVQRVEVLPFMPAGELGGPTNVLVPGTLFPPLENSFAILKRQHNGVRFKLHTTGLPEGAYTVWYVIFNDPSSCIGPGIGGGVCGEEDLFLPSAAVVWGTGNIVSHNGVGHFSDKIAVGETRSETVLLGADLSYPLENPQGAEIHLIVKYHGPASNDKEVLWDQTHTLLGSCGPDEGANSFDAGPFGIQCFDPQLAILASPGLI
ncbi:MAG: hypothetical protein OER04_08185 [Cyclobacteriaceae bacterium]|nr:hypothetical protein [Cyclobacteriaceae bacterium]